MLDPRIRRRPQAPALGFDTGSGGGTTVRVGGVNQTRYLMAHSLTMRLNTFDFAVRDPVSVPALGDMVYVLEPAWDGQVISVQQRVEPGQTWKIYSITATNSKPALAAPAPFGLSDSPASSVIIYGDLSITKTRNDSGDAIRGTATVYRDGLWPLMTFTLTSANLGLSAQQYTVTNMTVTWPLLTTPVYKLEFGDPMVTLSAWVANVPLADGTITGTMITDGSVTTPKLAANAVTAAKIAAGTITANEIAAGSITANEIAAALSGTISFTGGIYQRGASQILQLDSNGAAISTNLQVESTAGQPAAVALHVAGEGFLRASLNTTNKGLVLGSGAAGVDTYIYRSAAKTLRIDTDGATTDLTAIVLSATNVTATNTFKANAYQEGALAGSIVPSGGIIMWSGTIATIPPGWLLCDGTSGTPNLIDRFIVGAGPTIPPGGSGGTTSPRVALSTHALHDSHTSATSSGPTGIASLASTAAPQIPTNVHTHTVTATPVTHNAHGAHDLPQWYVLAYIMRA